MVRRFKELFLIVLVVLFTVQFVGTACADRLVEWSNLPLDARDHIPGGTDGQTETDGNQGEAESEITLAQVTGFHILPSMRSSFADSCSCPRKAFDSDLFRPPTLS
jgi:hypothetical protein